MIVSEVSISYYVSFEPILKQKRESRGLKTESKARREQRKRLGEKVEPIYFTEHHKGLDIYSHLYIALEGRVDEHYALILDCLPLAQWYENNFERNSYQN